MKWYDKIGIAILGLLATAIFLFLRYMSRIREWLPGLFFVKDEVAPSIVIVLWVIESSNRREKRNNGEG